MTTKKFFESIFTKNVVKYLNEAAMPLDKAGTMIYTLYALYEPENELHILDNDKQEKVIMALYKELEYRGFIEQWDGKWRITQKGSDLIQFVEGELISKGIKLTEVIAVTQEIEDLNNWFNDWLDLFPKYLIDGKRYLREKADLAKAKMQLFLKDTEYDKETIMRATKEYLKSKEKDAYKYCRSAHYFISKLDTDTRTTSSDLADWCLLIQDGNLEKRESFLDLL